MVSLSETTPESLTILLDRPRTVPLKQTFDVLKDVLLCCALVFVLPNLITWTVLGNSPELFRGWLNVEIAALTAAYLLTRSWPLLVFLAIDIVADLVEPIAHTFYFDLEDAIEAMHFLNVLPVSRIVLGGVCLMAYVGLVLFTLSAGSKRILRNGVMAGLTVAVCLLSVSYEAWSGRYILFGHSDSRLPLALLVRTPVSSIGVKLWKVHHHQTRPPQAIDSPIAHLLHSHSTALTAAQPNVVLVMVESWGSMKNTKLADGLAAPLLNPAIASKYNVETGIVPFVGSTIFGESREICGLIFNNGIENATADQLNACYPAQFAREGYETIGIHGFYPRMYGRERWFPKAGFQESLFEPQLKKMGMSNCPGGLIGTCDLQVSEYIHQRLLHPATKRPQFIRWTSLNSHLPIEVTRERLAAASCDSDSSLRNDGAMCIWYSLVKKVNDAVARTALDEGLPATVFIVVGDHAPPFYNSERRAQFSQTHVPYVILTPKTILRSIAAHTSSDVPTAAQVN